MGQPTSSGQLVVFCGLPGVGKTAVSRRVADLLGASFLRIDTIEAAIVSTLMPYENNPVGYVVAVRIAADQLRAERPVVADAVNNVVEARQAWLDLAAECAVPLRFVEVICSDPIEHRRRVESRSAEMPGHAVPTWDQVRRRGWQPFNRQESARRLLIDNLGDPARHAVEVVDWLAEP